MFGSLQIESGLTNRFSGGNEREQIGALLMSNLCSRSHILSVYVHRVT